MSRDPENIRLAEQGEPAKVLPFPERVEELGQHAFPADPREIALCIYCGCTLDEAEARTVCGG